MHTFKTSCRVVSSSAYTHTNVWQTSADLGRRNVLGILPAAASERCLKGHTQAGVIITDRFRHFTQMFPASHANCSQNPRANFRRGMLGHAQVMGSPCSCLKVHLVEGSVSDRYSVSNTFPSTR